MKKYKILVLSDLNSATTTTLKSTISLAKIINGEIELLTVKKPTDIVENDNQLSAMRTINSKHTEVNKKIQKLTAPLTEKYGLPINYSVAFGNVKNEIEHYIQKARPDIVVLGKRRPKAFSFIGDSISQFVLSSFNGVVMIANNKRGFEPDREISLGVLNGLEPSFNLKFAQDLIGQTQKPMKAFNIIGNRSTSVEMNTSTAEDRIEYVFEYNDNTVKNLSKYLSKSNTDLLFLQREKSSSGKQSEYTMPDLNDVVSNLNVTLMVTGSQNTI